MLCRLPHTALWLFLLFPAIPGTARADDWPVPVAPSHEPEPYQFQAKVLKQAPPEFLDDAPACMVYYGVRHLVQPDGVTETIIHEITRLNGKKGIENLGEYRSISFDPAYQKLTLNLARVIKADGKVIPIEPKHVKLRDSSTDYSSYDQDKELVISFPGLEVGDLFEVKWTTVGQHPENQGQFFRQYLFGSAHYPILRDSFLVRLPKEKPLKYKTINGSAEPKVHEKDGQRYYHWTITNHPAPPREEDLPSKEELRLQLVCSTFASWADVGKWKQKLRKDCWECTPQIKKIVQEVTAGLKTPEQKAATLTYWVRKKIRYVSFVSSTHRYAPSKPGVVLANLYGDCKDQAQMLAVMLREAGLKVQLVTLGQRGDGQVVPEVPSPWGTHAIVLTRIGGENHWIDTTATFAGWDFLPHADRDRVAYLTDEAGTIEISRTPKAASDTNRFAQTTWVHVQPDGTSLCKRKAAYHGLAAISQRNKWIDTPSGEIKRLLTAHLQDSHSRSQLLSLTLNPSNLLNLDQPVQAMIDFQIAQHFSGKYLEAAFSDSHVWSRLLAFHADLDRKHDLDLWAPFESTHRYVIQLPPHFRFDTGSWEKLVKSKWGSLLVQVERDPDDDRKLEIFFYTVLEQTRVKLADFAEFRKFHAQVQDNWRVWLGIVSTKNLDDTLALEAALVVNPKDMATAKILIGLYKHHGKTDAAQRVLKGTLVHFPADQNLWEMYVQATTTLGEEEAVYRQMVLRFPEETKYALALAATCQKRGNFTDAKKILEPLTKANSGSVRGQAYYHLAKLAMKQKKPAKALEFLQQAKKENAASVNTVPALQMLGQIQEQLGQAAEAIQSYRQALKVDPSAKSVFPPLIKLELTNGHNKEALDVLKQYAPLVQGDVAGLNQAAALFLELNRLDDAFDLAWQARDITFNGETQKILGLVFVQKGDHSKAVFHLERANPDAAVLAGLIQGHLALGNLDHALDCFVAAAQLPNPGPGLTKLLTACAGLSQRKAGLQAFAPVLPNDPDGGAKIIARFVCAEYAHQVGRPNGDVKILLDPCFGPGIKLGPAHALRALLALEKGQIKAALADAELAIKFSPTEARAFFVRGRIRHETGHPDALKDLHHAAQLSNYKDGHILHWLAAAQFDAGQHKEALATQQQAVKLLPDEPELIGQLQKFQKSSKK